MREGETLRTMVVKAGFRASVIVIGVLAFLPVADWISEPPGTRLPPPLWALFLFWLIGLVGIGFFGWILGKVISWGTGPSTDRIKEGESLLDGKWIPIILLLILPTALISATSLEIFDAKPLHIDAMTQAFQGQVFSRGQLNVPTPDDPPFFSTLMVVDHGGRTFSHFAPGWAALLALGILLGIPWIMAPLCAGLSAYGLYLLLRENGEGQKGALFAGLLLASSPWVVFNGASWMNHIPALAFVVLGSAALVRGIRRPDSWAFSGIGGALLGLATLIRPLEGVAFGLPATVWIMVRAWREPSARRSLAAFGIGGCLSMGMLLGYNWLQHGGAMTFGFDLQWGTGHGLGFHEAPWGPDHTLLRGIQLLNGYFLALQMLFSEAPVPALLPAFVALLLVRRLDALDRYLLTGSLLVLLGYVSFWGEGDYLGPRYLIPLAPIIAIWTARFGRVLAQRKDGPGYRRWGNLTVVLMVISGWMMGVPARWEYYSQSLPFRRVDVSAMTQAAAADALILVPSPWSSQVLARLRGTGLSRQRAQWLHDRIGLCRLDVALSHGRQSETAGPQEVEQLLLPLTADSAGMVRDLQTGAPGDPFAGIEGANGSAATLCEMRLFLEQTKGGYLQLPFYAALGPTWTGDGAIVARDLSEENPRLLSAFPDRRVYFLQPTRVRGSVREFRLSPLNVDSARAVWMVFDSVAQAAEVF